LLTKSRKLVAILGFIQDLDTDDVGDVTQLLCEIREDGQGFVDIRVVIEQTGLSV
jgi:hypothetical protein